jgi:hypothetical protein
MAKTLAIGKIPRAYGVGRKIAVGTVLLTDNTGTDIGSFSILDASGSKSMRQVDAVLLQPFSGSMHYNASGSSNGYIAVSGHATIGTPEAISGGTTQIVASFIVLGGALGGSI